MDKKNDRRKYPRYQVQCSVYCGEYRPRLEKKDMQAAEMLNISMEGALFESARAFPLAELLTIEMNLIGWQHFQARQKTTIDDKTITGSLRVAAEVVRIVELNESKYHIGIKFLNLRAQDQEILKDYIKKRVMFEL
jgi:c-di-GMP-binding flagellar brake protein YcgR